MDKHPQYWHLAAFNFSKKLTRDEMEYMHKNLSMVHFKKGEQIKLNQAKISDVYFMKKGSGQNYR